MSSKTVITAKGLVETARTYLAESTFAPDKAADLLQAAIRQDPTYVNALLLQSTLSSRLGHLTSALAEISLAIELDRGNSDTHRLASLYGSRANLLYRLGRYSDAVTDLKSSLQWEPDNGMWCFELGRVYMQQGNVRLAQWCFHQTMQEPMWSRVNELTRPKVYALYGRSCLIGGEYRRSRVLLQTCMREGIEESAAVLHDLGLAHYFEGTSLSAAVDYLMRAVESSARSVDYIKDLGLALVRCRKYNDALTRMNEAVLRSDQDTLLRFYRGCIELELGMGPEALKDLQVPVALGKTRQAKKVPAVRHTAVRACLAMGLVHIFCEQDLSSAAAVFETVELHTTQEVSIRLYAELLLGLVRHREGDRHAALRALHKALQLLREIVCVHTGGDEVPSPMSDPPQYLTDAEMLTLTHLGLVYSDLGYADLAARHFHEACLRTKHQSCAAAQADVCFFRHAVSQVEMNDILGALRTLRVRHSVKGGHAALSSSPLLSIPAEFTQEGGAAAIEVVELEKVSDKSSDGSGELRNATPLPVPTSLVCHYLSPGETENLRAVILRRLGRLEKALSYATAAIEATEPSKAGATASKSAATRRAVPIFLYNRALILFSLARYPEALTDVQECIRSCSRDESVGALRAEVADPYYLQGRIHHSLGAYNEALDDLTEALRLNPSLQHTSSFSYAYGVLLAIAGRLGDALRAFTDAINAHTEASVPRAKMGSGQQQRRGPSFRIKRRAPLVYYHERAKVYQQLGHYADALKDFEVVLDCASGTPLNADAIGGRLTTMSLSIWGALVNRALTLKELKRYNEAAMDWDTALRFDRSGILSSFTSQDIYELPYMHLCSPGAEMSVGEDALL